MWFIKSEYKNWLGEHAEQDDDGRWHCRETGAVIKYMGIVRPVLSGPLPVFTTGISSEVFPNVPADLREVCHLYCPVCTGVPQKMEGKIIRKGELLKLKTAGQTALLRVPM